MDDSTQDRAAHTPGPFEVTQQMIDELQDEAGRLKACANASTIHRMGAHAAALSRLRPSDTMEQWYLLQLTVRELRVIASGLPVKASEIESGTLRDVSLKVACLLAERSRMADSHADLLAALEACLPWVHSTMAVADQARAALAKAKATPTLPTESPSVGETP